MFVLVLTIFMCWLRQVRLRYYGPRQLGPAGGLQQVFVERKTHREKWTGERSIKVLEQLVAGWGVLWALLQGCWGVLWAATSGVSRSSDM
jgi:hypothetical protein